MKSPKSPALRRLLGSFYAAALSNHHPDIPLPDIIAAHQADALTRRRFLAQLTHGALAVGALSAAAKPSVVVAGETKAKTATSSRPQPRIAIIGAGMAGLSCALTLQKQGIQATLYEASRRVGGRILTHYNDGLGNGVVAELGGEFIDSNHADMLALVKEFKLDLDDLIADYKKHKWVPNAYFIDDKHYTEADVIAEFKKIAPLIEKDVEALGEDYDTPRAEAIDQQSLAAYVDAMPCASWLKDILKYAYIAEFGLEPEEQSALNLVDLIGTDTHHGFEVFGESDERYRIKQGNSALIKAMQARLASHIVLEAPLTAIKDHAEAGYVLSFKGREEVVADYVVLTLPFTVLRDITLDLREMTEEKRNAIQSLGYGQNNKLLLGFKGRPWRAANPGYAGYLYSKTIPNGWDAGDARRAGAKPDAAGYTVLLGGAQALALDARAEHAKHAPTSHGWKTALPSKDIDTFVDALDAAFKGSRAAYTGRHLYASWTSNPYAKTSYACYKVGQWFTVSGHEQAPIGKVLFAGEHCSDAFQGYMNGAAETGRVAAEDILSQL
jgi:monoamine oxidase